ncbi:MAG: type III-A CRISPR-associated protein Csm2 [Leptospiraceae bacterium]|nr:type III-A CRISPR-associated protein Csm2 [Leptospiraceae bacterium]
MVRKDSKYLRSELLSKESEKFAEELLEDKIKGKSMTSTQLRRYYGEVKNLERQLISLKINKEKKEEAWFSIEPMVKLLKAKASYDTREGKSSRLPDSFKNFIHSAVNSIETEDDFKAFLKFFEACVGYYSAIAPK